MTEDQWHVIRELRHEGYAVCIFTPEELGNADSSRVEDAMCEKGNEIIGFRNEGEEE